MKRIRKVIVVAGILILPLILGIKKAYAMNYVYPTWAGQPTMKYWLVAVQTSHMNEEEWMNYAKVYQSDKEFMVSYTDDSTNGETAWNIKTIDTIEYYEYDKINGTWIKRTQTQISGGSYTVVIANTDIKRYYIDNGIWNLSEELIYDAQPVFYDNSNVPYARIPLPREDYVTVDRIITYWITYHVNTEDEEKIKINIKSNGNMMAENADINGWTILENSIQKHNGWSDGFIRLMVQWKTTGIKNIGIEVVDEVNNIYLYDSRNIQIKVFEDGNSDGKDDITNENNYDSNIIITPNMDPNEYINNNAETLDIQLIIDNIIDTLDSAFGWISSFSSIIGRVFEYLPIEIRSVLLMGVSAFVISFIIKVFRG